MLNKRGALAVSQVIILLVGIVAFSILINLNSQIVSASGEETKEVVDVLPSLNQIDKSQSIDEIFGKAQKEGGFMVGEETWVYDSLKKDFHKKSFTNIRMSVDDSKILFQNVKDGIDSKYENLPFASDAEIKKATPLPVETSHGFASKIVDFFGGEGETAPKGQSK
jgi:hypothetical protein